MTAVSPLPFLTIAMRIHLPSLTALLPLVLMLPATGPVRNCGCGEPAQPVIAVQQDSGQPASMTRVHDPSIAKEGGIYHLFSTGRGITLHTSTDMKAWKPAGRVFPRAMPWTASLIPGSTDHYWAPDISRFGGKWRLYYSVSTFGSNRSAIGLATNVTLDPSGPDYAWKDEGPVIESNRGDDYNAIDPNVALDAAGQPWLSFGSFWSGIKLVKLDAATGLILDKTPRIYALASRPRGGEIRGAVEAPYIVRRGGFYYLFVSFDFCCRGVNSTYNVRVGRSKDITGPYTDRDGKPMLDGGGTRVVWGAGRWKGPGHNAAFREASTDWLVYHAYDAEDSGIPKLRIEKLTWTKDGWPEAPSMAGVPGGQDGHNG